MADDLKPTLTKVLASKGEKKFCFAYGAGKRKDGQGDGELIVRPKKPKKQEVEGELADCKEVLEGVCWVGTGTDDGQTIYFQGKGKKLSPAIVAKMALTAKRATGRQYDFQVPSPEEEARADKLSEGESDEATATAPPPPPPGTSAELQARLKAVLLRLPSAYGTVPGLKEKLGPLVQTAANLVQQGSDHANAALSKLEMELDAVRPGAAAPTAESAYQARVKALTEDLKQAITSGTAAGNEAKLRFSESQVFSRKRDFAQALALLDVVEAQIKKALGGATTAPSGMAAFNARAKTVMAAVERATAADPGRGADLKKRLALAMASAMSKQVDAALAALDAIESDANAPATPPAVDRWNAERAAAVAKLQEEIKVVVATKDPDAGHAELELKAVMKQLNGQLETRQQATEMERYLQQDEVVADVCELAFDLKTPLLRILNEIKPRLAA
jgi:hypothetical protein